MPTFKLGTAFGRSQCQIPRCTERAHVLVSPVENGVPVVVVPRCPVHASIEFSAMLGLDTKLCGTPVVSLDEFRR